MSANLGLGVIPRALCLPSFLYRPGITGSVAFLLTFLVAAYIIVLIRVPRTPSGLALGAALVLLTLDVANKQSFFNHYQLSIGLMIVAVCLAATEVSGAEPAAAPR